MLKINMIVMNKFLNDSRVHKEAISASEQGFHVKVVALADDENVLPLNEAFAGGDIKRIALTTKKWPRTVWFQLIKYLEYMFKAVKECRDANIIHSNDLAPLPIAVIIKILSFGKTKILYDAHELETERNGLYGLKKWLSRITERYCIRFADSVVTVSDSIADWYEEHYKITRPRVVRNIPAINKSPVLYREQTDLKRKFQLKQSDVLFIYQGGMMPNRGIERLLEIFAKVKSNRHVVFMGGGILTPKIQQSMETNDNIHYLPAVPQENVLSYTATADIGINLTPLNACLSYHYALPNKLFEYIIAGLPVIISDVLEKKRLVNQFDCGWIATEDDKEVIKFINNISLQKIDEKKKGVKHAQNNLSWQTEVNVLLAEYDKILKK